MFLSDDQVKKMGGIEKVTNIINDYEKKIASKEEVFFSDEMVSNFGGIENVEKIFNFNKDKTTNQEEGLLSSSLGKAGKLARAGLSGVAQTLDSVYGNPLPVDTNDTNFEFNNDFLSAEEQKKAQEAMKFAGQSDHGSFEDLPKIQQKEGVSGLTENFNQMTGYNDENASFDEKIVNRLASFKTGGINLPASAGSAIASVLIGNPFDQKTNPMKYSGFEMLKEIFGGVAGSSTPNALKALKNIPDNIKNKVSNYSAKKIAKGMSPEERARFLEHQEEGLIVDPREYTNAKIGHDLSLEHPSELEIKYNQETLKNRFNESIDKNTGTQNLTYDEQKSKILNSDAPNSADNKVIGEVLKKDTPVHLAKTEEEIVGLLKKRSIDDEAKSAVQKTLEWLEPFVKETNKFLNLYKEQASNHFNNFIKNEENFRKKLKTISGQFENKKNLDLNVFEDFVIGVGKQGIDVNKKDNLQNLWRVFNNKKNYSIILEHGGDAVINGFVNNSLKSTTKRSSELLNNFKQKYQDYITTITKNTYLNRVSSTLSNDLREIFPEFKQAMASIAERKGKSGYSLVENLWTHGEGQETLFNLLKDPYKVKQAKSMLSGESLEAFNNLAILKTKNMLKGSLSTGNYKKVLDELYGKYSDVYKELLGEQVFKNFSQDVEKIGNFYKGVLLKSSKEPLKTANTISLQKKLFASAAAGAGAGLEGLLLVPAINTALSSYYNIGKISTSKAFANDIAKYTKTYEKIPKNQKTPFMDSIYEKAKKMSESIPKHIIDKKAYYVRGLATQRNNNNNNND